MNLSDKWMSILKGAGLAAAGAVAAYLGQHALDFGMYAPFVGAAVSIALNAIRKHATPDAAE